MISPGTSFNPSYVNKELEALYLKEIKFARVVGSFSLLAFIITGMGLSGLALLITERHMKEIAVRKILGASNKDILFRMQREFLIYSLTASLISIPAAWFIMNAWLSEFYYNTGIHWYFLLLAAFGISLFVSSIIAIRLRSVLKRKPIIALRYE